MPSRSKPSVISNTTDGDDSTRRAQRLLNSKGKGNPSTTFPIKDVGTYRPSAASGSFIESNGEILCNRMPKVKPYTAAQGYPWGWEHWMYKTQRHPTITGHRPLNIRDNYKMWHTYFSAASWKVHYLTTTDLWTLQSVAKIYMDRIGCQFMPVPKNLRQIQAQCSKCNLRRPKFSRSYRIKILAGKLLNF